MPCRLLVILGAGASYDCTSDAVPDRRMQFRPPLVTELFAPRPSFTRILNQYPLAEQAAAEIRPALAHGSVALEAFLRDHLRDSAYPHARRQYWAIPLYLQHLLFEICMWDWGSGRGYTPHPDSYDRLVNAALRVDDVAFVTLNYDDLFDRRLFIHGGGLTSMDAYLGNGQNWALIKLHGSINWGRALTNTPPPRQIGLGDNVLAHAFAAYGDELQLDDAIHLRPHPNITQTRFDELHDAEHGGRYYRLYYPALSAPLGAEDELVCPEPHVDYLKEFIGRPEPLDVLVIGYSGLDREVLNLLSWGGRAIRSLWVISESDESALQTALRITERIKIIPPPGQNEVVRVGSGFTEFAQGSGLDEYIERIRAVAREEDSSPARLGR